MKSRFAYSLIVVLFLAEASAQSYKQRNQFIGRVKAIRIDLAYLDANGNPDKRGRHLSCLRAFDTNGNLTMSEDFYAYGKISYGKDTYLYDAAGRMIETAHEINGSVYKTSYEYDGGGQLIRQDREGQGHRSKYIYNAEGKPKEGKRFTLDGADDGREVFSYDDSGRLKRRVLYDSQGSIDAEEARAYDSEGHLVSQSDAYMTRTYSARGQLLLEVSKNTSDPYYRKVAYEYNANDLIAKEEEYDNKGLRRTFLYAYEYDPQRNWIKEMTTQTSREEEKQIWESYRTITYY
jgi:hypothetical protein